MLVHILKKTSKEKHMNNYNDILYIFPESIKNALVNILNQTKSGYMSISEIRLRINQNPFIILNDRREIMIDNVYVTREIINSILNSATRYSMYAFQDTIRQGFISLRGGHRLGVLGQAVVNKGIMTGQRNISYLNLRISHEHIGCANPVMDFINTRSNVLIISPPGCGKTTMLRDIVRNYSYGFRCSPLKVTIIDERGEIAACVDGIPQNDIGPRTDVCNMGNKKEGVFAALRSMSPDLIVMDEIGGDDDVEAVKKAVYLGVRVIATVHGYSLKDCYLRSDLAQIINNNGFNKIIVLSNKNGSGTVEDMIDLEEKSDCVY